MKPLFRTVAVCPRCRGELAWAADSNACRCMACDRRYGTVKGIPLMRLDATGEPLQDLPSTAVPGPRWRQALSRATRVPAFSHKTATSRSRLPRFLAALGEEGVSLNLGSGTTDFGPQVLNLDIGPFAHVDAVAGGECLPLPDHAMDAVITLGVLEHVANLSDVLAEIDRVLRPGGQVYHEIPFVQGFHGSPGDYRRFTVQGVEDLVTGYQIVDRGVAVGPSSAVGWLLSEWLALLVSLGNDTLHRLARRVFGWLLSPLKYADTWLEGRPQADRIACALYVVARKP